MLPNALVFQDACDIFSSFNRSLYVVDCQKNLIVKLFPNGSLNYNISSGIAHPTAIFVTSNGTIYVSDRENSKVWKFTKGDITGQVIVVNGISIVANQGLHFPRGIFVDDEFNLFIANEGKNQIQKWPVGAEEGVIVAAGSIKCAGQGPSDLRAPTTVTVDRMRRIYIADNLNKRIVRWSPNTNSSTCIISCVDMGMDGHGTLNAATSLRFDSHGNLYVSESNKNRIQKFTLFNNTPQSECFSS